MPNKFPAERREVLVSPERRQSLNPPRIIPFLPIAPNHEVADVGCGNGFFTFPLAEFLASGKVYAVDIQKEMLEDVREKVEAEGIKNVQIVLSQELEISLPQKSIDGIFSAFRIRLFWNND